MQPVCLTPTCIVDWHRKQEAKKVRAVGVAQRKARTEYRRETRRMREAIMGRGEWVKKVQKDAFNPYIRERDRNERCITCDRTNEEVAGTDGWKPGGLWDCGHYLSVGSHPNLRFIPDNAHKQCKSCNGGSKHYALKGRSVKESYDVNIVERIGQAAVDALKADNDPRKYTIEELKQLYAHFTGLTRALKKGEA